MTTSIAYLQNTEINNQIEKGQVFQKSAKTFLRKPAAEEIGVSFPTFVKTDEGVRQESSNTVSADVVVARNPGVIGQVDGKDMYNEWLIPVVTAIKNYGKDVFDKLTVEFVAYKKQATVKAIPLTPEVLETLGVEGDTLYITVSWSPEPMIAKIGDYLTSGGYSISKNDMKDYEVV